MRASGLILAVIAACAALLFHPPAARAQAAKNAGADSLSGQVSSAEEGMMEGVLVSAKKDGSTVSFTVVSDHQGHYRFPAGRLEQGHYLLKIRAGGYDLDSPTTIDIAAGKNASADLKLKKTANLASQLTNSDWIASFPGTPEQKASVGGCTHCHTMERIARSQHDTEEFMAVIDRMGHHTPESFPLLVQADGPGRQGEGEMGGDQLAQQAASRRKLAEFLASINLSKNETWQYPLKTAARPTGKATQVLITEYDLPKKTRQPHDVVVDSDGNAWYASFGELILGKLDPKTGKVTEYPIPELKPGSIKGNLDVNLDEEGNLWIAMTFQGGIAKFDRKTEKFTMYKLPEDMDGDYREFTFVAGNHNEVDGKIWVADAGTYVPLRLDLKTGKWESFEVYQKPRPNIYEVTSDAQNNAWFNVMGRQDIGEIDAKTGKITIFPLPTPRSAPRRGTIDATGKFWIAENRGNKIAMFDTKSHEIQEWAVPDPTYFPYAATADKYGEAWAVTEYSDSVLRLDTKTGQFTTYLMPRETNMRRAFVDDSGPQVKFWVGNTHEGAIVRVEPLDGPAVANAMQ
jgi:streptogramin lyase